MDKQQIINSARRTIELQAASVAGLLAFVNDGFVKAVERVIICQGRLVVSGIGKSAIVAQKIVATMNSTGTPALFMHAADAIHGDLGMVQENDVVLLISKSGDSPEIKVLVPLVKNFGNTLIGMVGNIQSYLAEKSDIVLNTTIIQEACPNNLAPTTSTTAQMVMGDALAICLMETKGFNSDDFARFHPGGALGKKLYLRVNDLLSPMENPQVKTDTPIKHVILEITKKRLGAAAVVNDKQEVIGIVTDGDIRRMLEKYDVLTTLTAKDIMSTQPKIIQAEALAMEAFEKMKASNISQLVVLKGEIYAGIIHLHDLVREGII
ncbi:SIS domain-containing protein [Ferruginibacter sp. HRS2-29]|uniref:KpsF/GutQ family sugar-phosphate isomerase n=1 Tax=Ferruginibacter sp. HRS2-29 TaxID=2487334 RepID=UPI0020CDA05C|nr:KpsF/GutQ family sugar-phosphate isomerase [Ferruginibacter sp. HRS2-29]MCP9752903.1 KpsF/GutQ family sugar-phosphate isomerase [Ferruginibacter sp. HRS2-29]